MSQSVKRSGQLPLLPRVKFLRQLKAKLIPVTTWLVLLFVLANQASATYSPTNVAGLLAAAKPISPIKTKVQELQPEVKSEIKSEVDATAKSMVLADVVTRPVPEITMEITAAEYIPPKLVVNTISASGNGFLLGQCTYYVALKRPITWGGNAGTWYYSAQATGYKVGQAPAVGAIMVSYEGSAAGHVAYVESVNPDGSFTVSEMNYNGNWGRITFRTLHRGDTYIVGFVY